MSVAAWLASATTADRRPVSEAFDPDATLIVPGGSELAGRYRGRAEIQAFVDLVGEMTDTLRIELVDHAIPGSSEVRLRLAATRAERHLDLDYTFHIGASKKGRILEGQLEPDDIEAHDRFWGPAQERVLSRSDRIALISAIRASPPEQGAGGTILLPAICAVIAAAIALMALEQLQAWRRPVELGLRTDQPFITRQLQLRSDEEAGEASAGPPSIGWDVVGANLRQIELEGSDRSPLVLWLPVDPAEACQRLDALEIACSGSEAQTDAPITLSWSDPVLLTGRQQITGSALDVDVMTGSGGDVALGLTAAVDTPPEFCVTDRELTVSISRSGGDPVRVVDSTSCEQGLRLTIGSARDGLTPRMTLSGLDYMQMTADAPALSLAGMDGRITVDGHITTEVSTLGDVSLLSGDGDAFTVSWVLDGSSGHYAVGSGGAIHAMTDQGDLIPSEWDRHSGAWGPILGGLIGLAVLSPLTLAVKRMTKRLENIDRSRVERGSRPEGGSHG